MFVENARSRYVNDAKASDAGEIFFLKELRAARSGTGTGTMATEVVAMKVKPLTELPGAGRVSRPRAVVRGRVRRRRARFRVLVAHSSSLRATVAEISLEKKTNGQKSSRYQNEIRRICSARNVSETRGSYKTLTH